VRVLMLGSDAFAAPFRALGAEVWTCGPEPEADIPLGDPDPEWGALQKVLAARGLRPEVVMVTDHVGGRRLPTGLAQAEAVTVFYGVDAPLNRFWQLAYARLFDLAFLDQPDEARQLAAVHDGAGWLPVAVDPSLYEGECESTSKPGVCFVGVVDARLRPKRSAVLARLARLVPVEVRGGRQGAWFPTQEAARLYRSYQVVLNENLFPGFTTRPLEVMAAGGCLLSEAAPGSMDRYFHEFEHLLYFGPYDLEQKLKVLLRDADLRRRLARQGREVVRAFHGFRQRAEYILRRVDAMSARPASERPRAKGGEALRLEGEALLMVGLRWPGELGRRRVLRGASRLRAAAVDGAELVATARWAGLADIVTGHLEQGLSHLQRAAEWGGRCDRLALALAAFFGGQEPLAREALEGLAEVEGEPGEVSFHRGAARLLREEGLSVSIGFSRLGLHPLLWSALEHLLEAVGRDPSAAEAWEELGDLLLTHGAPNQAYESYRKANELAQSPALEAKLARAGKEGYLL